MAGQRRKVNTDQFTGRAVTTTAPELGVPEYRPSRSRSFGARSYSSTEMDLRPQSRTEGAVRDAATGAPIVPPPPPGAAPGPALPPPPSGRGRVEEPPTEDPTPNEDPEGGRRTRTGFGSMPSRALQKSGQVKQFRITQPGNRSQPWSTGRGRGNQFVQGARFNPSVGPSLALSAARMHDNALAMQTNIAPFDWTDEHLQYQNTVSTGRVRRGLR